MWGVRLSLWGSWREAPERASPARKDRPCSDKQALCQSDAIAAPSNHRQHPCPLRHLRGHPSQRERLCETGRLCPLSCNQTVAFFTLFSKIKGKLKNVLLKKWRICVTLHPSCNGIFGDSGVFSPVFYGSGGRRQSDSYAFFLLFCPFWLFSGHLALWQGGKYGKIV